MQILFKIENIGTPENDEVFCVFENDVKIIVLHGTSFPPHLLLDATSYSALLWLIRKPACLATALRRGFFNFLVVSEARLYKVKRLFLRRIWT